MKDNYVVIMAGGVGSRFWPFSRSTFPKQFHDVLGVGKSLLQLTADRFENVCPKENIYIVTNVAYKDLVKEQLPYLSDDQILCEPTGRNTAPCVAYAAYKIYSKNKNANLVISPADHVILKEQEFEKKILSCLDEADKGDSLITLGIQPTRPDTGYGYINFEKTEGLFPKVIAFKEKPDAPTAQSYIDSGDFVWNAGIFIWKADSIISAFEQYTPELGTQFSEGNSKYYTSEEDTFIEDTYGKCESISIDYAIMEHATNVLVQLADIGWSDLGTWKSLYEVSDKQENNNVIDGDVYLYDTKNTIIKTPKERLVVVQGLDNYIVAEYDNVLMICNKDEEQKVKEFVGRVKEEKDSSYY